MVASIQKQTFADWELIVAAQGSDPALLRYLDQCVKEDPRISYLDLKKFGRSYALNEAVKKAKGDIVAFTDDDCVAAPDWLATIADCFTTNASVGIVAGDLIASPRVPFRITVCPATYTIEYIHAPTAEQPGGPEGFYWAGANFAARREVLEQVGPFDEFLGPGTKFPAAEDIDFALRAEALGVVIWTTPKSRIFHTHGRRIGLKNFLKHHRAYAVGSGALGAKLLLSQHRLAEEWGVDRSQKRGALPPDWVKRGLRNPFRLLLEIYKSKYSDEAYAAYMAQFELDSRGVTRERSDKGSPVPNPS